MPANRYSPPPITPRACGCITMGDFAIRYCESHNTKTGTHARGKTSASHTKASA